ncbi:MAG TPA: acyltransferase [Propionibacteriaceae bacterium]
MTGAAFNGDLSNERAEAAPAAGESQPVQPGRFRGFDGLRALAVLIVFVHHLDPDRLPGGVLGVTLFFSLSGFLITRLLLSEHQRLGGINLRRFYLRRLLRLMPALVAMVAVTLVASVFVGNGETLGDAWPALTYLSDFVFPLRDSWGGVYGHTWSLSVEEQFYLIWPAVLVVGLARRWRLRLIVILAAAGCVGLTVLTTLNPDPQTLINAYRLPHTHLPIMFCGILLAFATHEGLNERARRFFSRRFLAMWILALLAVCCLLLPDGLLALYRSGWLLAGVVLTVLVGHVVTDQDGPLVRLLSVRPARWLGERSYGFYLWHYPVILLLKPELGGSVPLLVACSLTVTLVLTEASWRMVERPFNRLKRRYEPARAVRASLSPERSRAAYAGLGAVASAAQAALPSRLT